jgi:hypothetical protein
MPRGATRRKLRPLPRAVKTDLLRSFFGYLDNPTIPMTRTLLPTPFPPAPPTPIVPVWGGARRGGTKG